MVLAPRIMDEERIKELQNQARAGDEAKRLLRALEEAGHLRAGNTSSSSSTQQSLLQNNDSIRLSTDTAAKVGEAQGYPSQPSQFPTQAPIQSRQYYSMYGTPSASSTHHVYRFQQHGPNVQSYGQSSTRQLEQHMPPQRFQAVKIPVPAHAGQYNSQHFRRVQDPQSTNLVPQQSAQLLRMMVDHSPQPSNGGQTSVVQPMMTAQYSSHSPWSISQHRQHPVNAEQRAQLESRVERQQQTDQRFEKQSHTIGKQSQTTSIPNTVVNQMAMAHNKPTGSPHPSSTAVVVEGNQNEVISISASINPSAQPSNEIISPATDKSGKSQHGDVPSMVPATGDEELIGVGGLEPVLRTRFVELVLEWAEKTPPGRFFAIPNSASEVLKDHDSKLYLVSPDGKGGKVRHRIDNCKQISGAASTRPSVEPTTKEDSQAGMKVPLGMEQMDYRPYGYPAQQQTHLYVHDKNFQFQSGLLPAKQQSRYQTYSVPSQLPNGVEIRLRSSSPSSPAGLHKQSANSPELFSTMSSSPRTPSQADKKHLAKDILRALQPSASKQPPPKRALPEDVLISNSLEQPLAKRHAPGPGSDVAGAVNLSSTAANQFVNPGVNDVIPPHVTAQPSVGDQELTPGQLSAMQAPPIPTSSALPSTLAPSQILDQPPIQMPSTSVTSIPSQPPASPLTSIQSPVSVPPQSPKTSRLSASLPFPTQSPVSVMPPSVSMSTLLPSPRPSQLSSFASTSKTMLPAPQTVARPPSPLPPSASQLRSNLSTTKTRIGPVVELPLSKPMSTSVPQIHKASTPLLPRRKPLARSDSVPAIATLPATSPVVIPAEVVLHNGMAQQSSTSQCRSSPDERQKTPLFLPSPTSSPSIDAFDDIGHTLVSEDPLHIGGLDDTVVDPSIIKLPKLWRSKGSNGEGRQTKPYVLVPPRPTYLKLFLAKELREANRRKARIRPGSEGHTSDPGLQGRFSSRLVEEPDINYADPASFDFVNDDAERDAMVLSCSRISERPCKWNGCDVVMDSAAKLIKHFASEHRPRKASKNSFACQWQQCGKHLPDAKKLFIHLRSHATTPLFCGYEDCDESFRNPSQLMKHHETEHRHDSPKPAAEFFTPILGPLLVAPQILPSYMVEARQVKQPPISKEKHASLSQWVLRMIAGPINLGIKRYNAAKPLRSADGAEERHGTQPYDFLTYPSVQYSSAPSQPSKIRNLDDLDSGEVSEMANDGMVLWYARDIKEEESSSDEISMTPLYLNDQAESLSDEEVVKTVLTG